MGIFYVDCTVSNPVLEERSVDVKAMVDSGSEYTWIPESYLKKAGITVKKRDLQFVMANGQIITRDVGYAVIKSEGFETIDEVIFGKKGDLILLGSRTLEGFPAIIDFRRKKLVAAGPLPVALNKGGCNA
ncbi:MAG: retroviral-like aspartic protease family protein [bacterium]